MVDKKSSRVSAKSKYTPSKGLGAQVRVMSVSCYSIFQRGHHDMLAFYVLEIFVEIKFSQWGFMYLTIQIMTSAPTIAL